MTEEEKLKIRIARTRKLLAAMHDRFWDDNAELSTLLQLFVEILDGKRDDDNPD